MSVRHSVGAIKQPSDITKEHVCLGFRGHVQVTDTQAAVTESMYAIEETFIRTYTCSVDAKHPGHVNGYVLLIVKFFHFCYLRSHKLWILLEWVLIA